MKSVKAPRPPEESFLLLETEVGCEVTSVSDKKVLSEAGIQVHEESNCPLNAAGKKVKAHIFQQNLMDEMYLSELSVGNPPQTIRGLFDTGSANTWILSDSVQTKNDKSHAYKAKESKTFAETNLEEKTVRFGSGTLTGRFVTDDLRIGSCNPQQSSG